MKAKKRYHKPQLKQVRLAIQNPVLATCASVNESVPFLPCGGLNDECADTTLP